MKSDLDKIVEDGFIYRGENFGNNNHLRVYVKGDERIVYDSETKKQASRYRKFRGRNWKSEKANI